MRESEKFLSEFYDSEKKVRLIGVRVSSLKKREESQRTLFDWNTQTDVWDSNCELGAEFLRKEGALF